MDWISVAVAMPDYDVDVLMWADGWKGVYAGYWRHSHEWIGRQRPEESMPLPDTNPTHWMPFPEPPAAPNREFIQAFPVSRLVRDAARNWQGLPQCISAAYDRGEIIFLPKGMSIRTLEGIMEAGIADWVIEGVKGELYPCSDDILRATYESAEKL